MLKLIVIIVIIIDRKLVEGHVHLLMLSIAAPIRKNKQQNEKK